MLQQNFTGGEKEMISLINLHVSGKDVKSHVLNIFDQRSKLKIHLLITIQSWSNEFKAKNSVEININKYVRMQKVAGRRISLSEKWKITEQRRGWIRVKWLQHWFTAAPIHTPMSVESRSRGKTWVETEWVSKWVRKNASCSRSVRVSEWRGSWTVQGELWVHTWQIHQLRLGIIFPPFFFFCRRMHLLSSIA